MNLLKSLIFILFLFGGSNVFSQKYEDFYKETDNSIGTTSIEQSSLYDNLCKDKRPFSEEKRLNVNVQMGASVSTVNNSALFTSYMSPSVSYKVTSKLTIKAGAMAMSGNFNNSNLYYGSSDSYSNSQNQNNFTYLLFAQGEYKVNDRLLLRGTTMKEVNALISQNGFSMNHIGFDYKISEHFRIGGDFSFAQGRNPFMYNSPYNSGFSSRNSSFMQPSMSFMNGMGRMW